MRPKIFFSRQGYKFSHRRSEFLVLRGQFWSVPPHSRRIFSLLVMASNPEDEEVFIISVKRVVRETIVIEDDDVKELPPPPQESATYNKRISLFF